MDDSRFDAIARFLARSPDRRAVLRAGLGAVAAAAGGLTGARDVLAGGRKRFCKQTCGSCQFCVPTSRGGYCLPRLCPPDQVCDPKTDVCQCAQGPACAGHVRCGARDSGDLCCPAPQSAECRCDDPVTGTGGYIACCTWGVDCIGTGRTLNWDGGCPSHNCSVLQSGPAAGCEPGGSAESNCPSCADLQATVCGAVCCAAPSVCLEAKGYSFCVTP